MDNNPPSLEAGYRRKRKSKSRSRKSRRSISRSRRLRQIKRKVQSVARKLRSLTRSRSPVRNRVFIIQRSPRRVPQIYIPTAIPARSVYNRSVSSKGFFRPAIGPMKPHEYQIGNRYYSMQN